MGNKGKTNKKRVLGIIDKIVSMASDGDYIYRGQPDAAYPHVSSTLYRAMENSFPEIRGANWLNMNLVQEEALKAAQKFASEDYSDEEMLSRVQHYSGDTNLIDFTTDYRVALFFACSQKGGEEGGKDGKIFLLETSNLKDSEKGDEVKMVTSTNPLNRITAQKSIFVQSRTGIIPNGMMEFVVEIPRGLKQPILDYLRVCHEISEYTIYNDLHGYIRNRKAHSDAIMEVYFGINYGNKSQNIQSSEEKDDALKKAIEHFDKAIRLAPDYAVAYNNRGAAKEALGNVPGAISDYDKSIEMNPDSAIVYHYRGNAKEALGDVSGAISDHDKAIALVPNYVEAYYNRGNSKRKLSDMLGAVSDYDKAIALNPNDAYVYNNRGAIKAELGDKLGAISDHDKAIALKPNDAMAYCNRGNVKWRLGDNVSAIKDSDIAIDLNPSFARAYLNRGRAFESLQNFQQALSDLENAEKLALQQNKQDMVEFVQEAIKRVKAKMFKL